jgi:hypothetical protein
VLSKLERDPTTIPRESCDEGASVRAVNTMTTLLRSKPDCGMSLTSRAAQNEVQRERNVNASEFTGDARAGYAGARGDDCRGPILR